VGKKEKAGLKRGKGKGFRGAKKEEKLKMGGHLE